MPTHAADASRASSDRPPIRRQAIAIGVLLVAVACGDTVTEPPPPSQPAVASQLAIVEGDAQVAAAGSTLPRLLSVRALDASGVPVEDVAVTWSALRGGRVSSTSTLTDEDGVASVERTLGAAAGEYTTRAKLPPGGGSQGEAVFSSIGLVQGAMRITGAETTRTDSVLATLLPYRVSARDHLDQPVPGVEVEWALISGSGSLSTAVATTDANGFAEAVHTLGSAVGVEVVVARVAGLIGSPVTFGATVTAGKPALMEPTGADLHLGQVGQPLPTSYGLLVTDTYGNPVRGAVIDWVVTAGGGTIPGTSFTDAFGHTAVQHTLGPEEGESTVTATLRDAPNVAPATFTATAVTALVWLYSGYYGAFFSPNWVDVPAGSTVGWLWSCFDYYYSCEATDPHDVSFEDDPTVPVSSPLQVTGTHLRTFAAPGTYRYRSTNYSTSFTEGMVGVVTVY